MKFLEHLIKKSNVFQRQVGLSVQQFKELAKKLEPVWNESEKTRKSHESRKRGVGAGHPYKHQSLEQKLLIVLMYYKVYATQELLGMIVDLDQANVSRLLKKMLPLIEKAADPALTTYLDEAKKESSSITRISDLNEFFKKYPDLKDVSTDATEQQCYRSKNYEKQKEQYSGKKKRHTLKVQLSVSKRGKIVDVSNSYGGSVHDKTIIDTEKTVEKLPEKTCHRFDSGYQGIKTTNPSYYLVLPIKKPKGKELSKLAKEHNRANSRRRVVAEHSIARVKKFRICSDRYRGRTQSHNQTFRNIASILNFKSTYSAAVM